VLVFGHAAQISRVELAADGLAWWPRLTSIINHEYPND
jgi:hypothetical protein